jgi:hypothetical protein
MKKIKTGTKEMNKRMEELSQTSPRRAERQRRTQKELSQTSTPVEDRLRELKATELWRLTPAIKNLLKGFKDEDYMEITYIKGFKRLKKDELCQEEGFNVLIADQYIKAVMAINMLSASGPIESLFYKTDNIFLQIILLPYTYSLVPCCDHLKNDANIAQIYQSILDFLDKSRKTPRPPCFDAVYYISKDREQAIVGLNANEMVKCKNTKDAVIKALEDIRKGKACLPAADPDMLKVALMETFPAMYELYPELHGYFFNNSSNN